MIISRDHYRVNKWRVTNMPEVQNLTKKRANARHEVNLEFDYMAPLLQAGPEDAFKLSS